jgi:hypothetical protein
MRNTTFRPKDHWDLLITDNTPTSTPVKPISNPVVLPSILETKRDSKFEELFKAEPALPSKETTQQIYSDVIPKLSRSIENETINGLEKLYMTQVQSIQERLFESEKGQRNLLQDMNKLQSNLRESIRDQEMSFRDGSQVMRYMISLLRDDMD